MGRSRGFPAGLLLCWLAGCGGGGGGSTTGTATGNGGSGAGNGGGGGGAGPGACVENPIFAPRPLGTDNDDIYRTIRIDPGTQDMFLNDLVTLFRFPRGGTEPQTVLDRTDGVGEQFWLDPDVFLLEGGFLGAGVAGVDAVLFTVPRSGTAGATPQPVLTIPPSDGIAGTFHIAFYVTVVGDDVYWIGNDGTTGGFGVPRQETHTLRRASWRTPGAPTDLYSSTFSLEKPVVAAHSVYIRESIDMTTAETQQRVIDLRTAGATAVPVPAALGGIVMAGDDDWLLVARQDLTDFPNNYGTFRMRPDGSQSQQIAPNPYPTLDVKNGTWVVTGYDTSADVDYIYTYVPATGVKKTLGCVDSTQTTVHAVALGQDAVYVSILRNGTLASILRYPL